MQFEESKEKMVPNANGIKCKLVEAPSIKETEKGKYMAFIFEDGDEREYQARMNDPFGGKSATANKINGGRILHFFAAFMKPEDYNTYKANSFDDLEDMLAKAEPFLVEDILETECTIMIGYNESNYLSHAAYDPCISTKYRPKELSLKKSTGLTIEERDVVKKNAVQGMEGADNEPGGMME